MASSHDQTGADLFVKALKTYGVTHVFGNPGTTELPIVDAISTSDLEYILGLHEDIAVGMAGGYASTRRYHIDDVNDGMPVGVANLHVAPGMAHGLGNLYGAMKANAPIVVTAGAHSTDFQHEEPNLQGNTVEMTQQFTKWSAEVKHVDALPSMLRRAFRVALTPPTGPVFLALPLDVVMAETDATPQRLGAIPSAGRGDPTQVTAAADALVNATEPVIVLGDQIAQSGIDAVDTAVKLAEVTGARVYGEMTLSEVNFPTGHPQWISRLPFTQMEASDALAGDVLLFVGCTTNRGSVKFNTDIVPESATSIQVGSDGWELGKNHPADVAILGDPGLVMSELVANLDDRIAQTVRSDRLDHLDTFRTDRDREDAIRDMSSASNTDRFSKQELAHAMYETAADALIVNEGLTSTGAMHDAWSFQPNHLIGNKGGGLGYGLPATLGAAFAERQSESDRPVIGFIGDGSYLYYPHSMYTAARYNLDILVIVPNNQNYFILKENTVKILGGKKADYEFIGMDFDPPVDLSLNARSHGIRANTVDATDNLAAAMRTALKEAGPSLLDVRVHD